MQYNQYLQTEHWHKTRKIKLDQRPFCQVCKTETNLHIHHKKYSYKGESILFKERISDLLTLCNSCHRLCHRYIFGKEKVNKRLCRVRRLMELGVKKNKAFWIAGEYEVWKSVYPEILNRRLKTKKTPSKSL